MPKQYRILLPLILVISLSFCSCMDEEDLARFEQASANGEAANESLRRCDHFARGWLELADPETGLIPRNTKDRYWNAKDSAADNYPFMVLTASFTSRDLFQGRMRQMLETEMKLTSRINSLPDTYDFASGKFKDEKPDLDKIIFGSSEYIKDGLLPLTEWLGNSPWSERMISLLDEMWARAPVETPYGNIVSTNVEVNGEMLQALSRIYWMKGDEKYLDWAVRLGDYYLLGDNHPTRNQESLRLRDHGCEIVSGLCELYAAVNFARPEKKQEYQEPVHAMLDRILEVGRNEHGLFYNSVNPVSGEVPSQLVADTWGYTFNGFYTVYLIDKKESYRKAVLEALSNLNDFYRDYNWERGSSDGYADSIESALNLYNREPVASAAQWIDSEIRVMWGKQQPSGVIEGWHGDGNFARTSIMYALWKSGGTSIQPWRKDVRLGAVREGDELYLSLSAEEAWSGKIHFDVPRHKEIMRLPLDWPRINQFPEWFTVAAGKRYEIEDVDGDRLGPFTGERLSEGIEVELEPGEVKRLIVRVIVLRASRL